MKTMDDWFDAYAVSHQNPTNKAIHWICVPLIFWSILALLASIPLGDLSMTIPVALRPYVHLGTLLVAGGLVFYLRYSISMSIGILAFSLLCLWVIAQLLQSEYSLASVAFGIFAAAWIGQFIGHKIEGAKPSFFEDVQFLLIGPAWLMSFLYKKAGIKY